ncbi:ROK family protein [Reinekea blandensis]|uniref:Glucose kinase n=1 Tax=Reinekea blandensis MED297 TaxID=314283 RepID=A4BAU0_9GAMM|nr:ROK family protein [Reinekea blandensis]EAR10553.1 glucose kinase [Reinekea sp. MED297] [Reinekea blandensis MED297]
MTLISIDLGGTRVKMGAFVNDRLDRTTVLTINSQAAMTLTLNQIANQVRQWQHDGLPAIDGIALALPGIVDRDRQQVLRINGKHQDAPVTDFRQWARQTFQCPLLLQNDAIAALQGEWQQGAGENRRNVIMLTLGTGIGTGAIVDGQLLAGAGHFAGNLGGHSLTTIDGAVCNCGASGCAEAQASSWALQTDFKQLWQSADQGDTQAQQQLQHTLQVWSRLIHNLILAYSPERVIIGGGIAARGSSLLRDLKARLPDNLWYHADDIDFRLAQLGDMAAVIGGAVAFQSRRATSDWKTSASPVKC